MALISKIEANSQFYERLLPDIEDEENKKIGIFDDGPRTEFHSNGKIRIMANYIGGMLNGNYVEFDQDGHIVKKCVYKNNEIMEVRQN